MNYFKFLFIVLIIFSIFACSTSPDPVDNSFDVDFYFKNLNKAAKSGTFELNGQVINVDDSGVYTHHFENAGNHTIDNVNMDDTKQDWLIVRYDESGENIGQQDTRTKDPISISLTKGKKVYMIKIPSNYDMDTYKTYLADILCNVGMFMLDKKNETGTDDINTNYINNNGGISESIQDKLLENTNLVDPWKRLNLVKDSNNSRYDITFGNKFTHGAEYGIIPLIEKMISEIIKDSLVTLAYLEEHVEGFVDMGIDSLFNNTLININSPDDFTYKPKLNRILKLAFNFKPGTRFYSTGAATSIQAYDKFGNPVTGDDRRIYTRDEIREIVSRNSLLQKVYTSMINPETFEFKDDFKKKILSNTRFKELYGERELVDTMFDVRDIILSNPKLINMILSKNKVPEKEETSH